MENIHKHKAYQEKKTKKANPAILSSSHYYRVCMTFTGTSVLTPANVFLSHSRVEAVI